MPRSEDPRVQDVCGPWYIGTLDGYCGWCGELVFDEEYLGPCVHTLKIGVDIIDTFFDVLDWETEEVDLDKVEDPEQRAYLQQVEWVQVAYRYSDAPGPHGGTTTVVCAVPAAELRAHPEGPLAAIEERFAKLRADLDEAYADAHREREEQLERIGNLTRLDQELLRRRREEQGEGAEEAGDDG